MRIVLHKRVVDEIAAQLELSSGPVETGGILLGWSEDDEVLVDQAGDPGPTAVHRVGRFERDLKHAQNLAHAAWMERSAQWIGEWHSHPGASLAPSELDLATYRSHLADAELGFRSFVALIVKAGPKGIVLAAWVIVDGHAQRVQPEFVA